MRHDFVRGFLRLTATVLLMTSVGFLAADEPISALVVALPALVGIIAALARKEEGDA